MIGDVLQKVDQLIEGQGQLIEVVSRTDQRVDIPAKGLANLTIQAQQGFDDIRKGIADMRTGQETILQILREKLP